jgi:oligoribonuclease NrnB/cAMP/cGMP phosphodiesterase (DHH superfamily)
MQVFYHNDNDGKCCAALIYQYYNTDPPDHCSEIPITFNKMDYGMRFPIEDISKDEKVYIVDYSIEVNEMKELLKVTEDIIWIDHHKSAIEKYSHFQAEYYQDTSMGIIGIRNINFAGCNLVWQHLNAPKEFPEFVLLVEDRDIWKWEFGENTRNYNDGLIIEDTEPQSFIWSDEYVERVIAGGCVVSKTKQVLGLEQLQERGFYIKFHGYDCFAINSDLIRGSEYLEMCQPEADIWMVFRLCHGLVNYEETVTNPDDVYWTVSLYSKNPDIDVSKIAMDYIYKGKIGGGHKGASGFQSKGLDFLYDKE